MLEKYVGLFEGLAEDEGVRRDWLYLNFAAGFQDPLRGYGEASLTELRTVARRFDPQGFFQKHTGGFKLWRQNGTVGA
jgi:hypothetical protein